MADARREWSGQGPQRSAMTDPASARNSHPLSVDLHDEVYSRGAVIRACRRHCDAVSDQSSMRMPFAWRGPERRGCRPHCGRHRRERLSSASALLLVAAVRCAGKPQYIRRSVVERRNCMRRQLRRRRYRPGAGQVARAGFTSTPRRAHWRTVRARRSYSQGSFPGDAGWPERSR